VGFCFNFTTYCLLLLQLVTLPTTSLKKHARTHNWFHTQSRKRKIATLALIKQSAYPFALFTRKRGFTKSGVSFITNDPECSTTAAADKIHGSVALIKSLHKISLTPFMYKQYSTPIMIEIDARNPVDEIHMCLIDCPLISLARSLRQTLLKEPVYTQVHNLGVPGTKRVVTLAAAPSTSCALKLSVKSRGCGINIWFLISVHQDTIPRQVIPKQKDRKRKRQATKDRVFKYAKIAVGDSVPTETIDFGLENEFLDQNTNEWL